MNVQPKLTIVIFCLLLHCYSFSQDSSRVIRDYINDVSSKTSAIDQKLTRHEEKALRSLQKLEDKMKRKLYKLDSLKAKELFSNTSLQITDKAKTYIPSLDTMTTALRFLNQPAVMDKVKELESRFGKAEQLKKLLESRRQLLKEQLAKLGFAKELKKLNKQVYYYSAQVNEYKALLKDKKKREKKALELLSKNKQFSEFMRKNSQLASLFRLPGNDPGASASLAGLQTRAQVNNLIQQQISAGGPNGMQQFQQNMQLAQTQLQQLKNKIMSSGGSSSSDVAAENFRPNTQKAKNFWKRLELGTNIQTTKNNGWFPVTSDLGLSLGYKPNDKSVIGIGASYKMGWGKDIRHIDISHQGVGLRSFAEIKLKGSFWISGGYEMNYRSAFNDFAQLEGSGWQQSGLIGMSKTVSMRSKFFKKTKLQLLWDFLSYEQVPRVQPVLFRVGYSF